MHLQRTRLIAPADNGCGLLEPSFDEMCKGIARNRQLFSSSFLELEIGSLSEWRRLAKSEILRAACAHTAQYRDIASLMAIASKVDSTSLIVGGHQPELFHPGVWFKNFCLDRLADRTSSIAINLIIDNDLAGIPRILVPQRAGREGRRIPLAYDRNGEHLPFEARPICDGKMFRDFPQRLKTALERNGIEDDRIARRLWDLDSPSVGENLGLRLAAMRHRLEGQSGLKTLEVPLSKACQTESFGLFFIEIARRHQQFLIQHNLALNRYRSQYRIRSRSHPVPALVEDGGWTELPFWIWTDLAPQRQRLFVRDGQGTLEFSNRAGVQFELGRAFDHRDFSKLVARGIALRPRALTTTMFARLAFSDFFVHGIGGAKYDELTDCLIREFWGLNPPEFGVATATFRLTSYPVTDLIEDRASRVSQTGRDERGIQEKTLDPTLVKFRGELQQVDNQKSAPSLAWSATELNREIRRIKEELRKIQFHPERFIDSADCIAQEWKDRKRDLLVSSENGRVDRLRRSQILQINEQLATRVGNQREQLSAQLDRLSKQRSLLEILGSRDTSFVLFPLGLIDQLKVLIRELDQSPTG